MPVEWATVLTSAGIGALVSSLATLGGQALERKARRRELVLAKAMELAKARTDLALEVSRRQPDKVAAFRDPAVMTEKYFQWLEHLLQKGALPPDAQEIVTSEEKRLAERGGVAK